MGFFNSILINGFFGCIVSVTALLLVTDPLKIIGSSDAKNLHLYKMDSAYQLLDLGGLFYLVQKNAILISVSITVMLLISMLFVSKAEVLAEKKKDIYYKLIIVVLISSSITIFSFIKRFCDITFY